VLRLGSIAAGESGCKPRVLLLLLLPLLLLPLFHPNSQIKMLADNPDQWALLLGAAFPNSSNFFLVRCMHGCAKPAAKFACNAMVQSHEQQHQPACCFASSIACCLMVAYLAMPATCTRTRLLQLPQDVQVTMDVLPYI
jgi:hypothetical protein